MPGYSWMFSGDDAQPNVDARDLVAYVRSLGRERSLAGEAGGEQVDHGTAMEMSSRYGAQAEPDTRTRITGMGLDASAPIFSFAQSADAIRLTHGKDIFEHNCSGCHGVNADGQGPAATVMHPRPIDLHREHFSDAHLATVLWDGVSGSAMPAWRQLEKTDLENVTGYVQSLQASVTSQSMTAAEFASADRIYSANCVSCHGVEARGNGLPQEDSSRRL